MPTSRLPAYLHSPQLIAFNWFKLAEIEKTAYYLHRYNKRFYNFNQELIIKYLLRA